jgi:hypothetical protein
MDASPLGLKGHIVLPGLQLSGHQVAGIIQVCKIVVWQSARYPPRSIVTRVRRLSFLQVCQSFNAPAVYHKRVCRSQQFFLSTTIVNLTFLLTELHAHSRAVPPHDEGGTV